MSYAIWSEFVLFRINYWHNIQTMPLIAFNSLAVEFNSLRYIPSSTATSDDPKILSSSNSHTNKIAWPTAKIIFSSFWIYAIPINNYAWRCHSCFALKKFRLIQLKFFCLFYLLTRHPKSKTNKICRMIARIRKLKVYMWFRMVNCDKTELLYVAFWVRYEVWDMVNIN